VAREGNRSADASLFRAVFSDSHLVDFALLNSILCTGLRAVYRNHSLWNHNFGSPELASLLHYSKLGMS
jgi:hypothetical protein